MKATVNGPAGVKVLADWLAQNKCMPKGVETWGFVENLAAFLRADGDDHLLAALWPLGRRLRHRRKGAGLGPQDARSPARSATPCRRAAIPSSRPASRSRSRPIQEKRRSLFVHPVAQQRGDQPPACPAALRPARSVPQQPLHRPGYKAAGRRRRISGGPEGRRAQRPARSLDHPDRPLRGGAAPGHQQAVGGRGPQGILDEVAAQWDAITQKVGLDKQKEAYGAWADKPGAYPKLGGGGSGQSPDIRLRLRARQPRRCPCAAPHRPRRFGYWLVAPAVFDDSGPRPVSADLCRWWSASRTSTCRRRKLFRRPHELPASSHDAASGALRPHLRSSLASPCRSSWSSGLLLASCSSSGCPAGRSSWRCSCCRS